MKCLLKWIAALAVVAGLLALAAALAVQDPRAGRVHHLI